MGTAQREGKWAQYRGEQEGGRKEGCPPYIRVLPMRQERLHGWMDQASGLGWASYLPPTNPCLLGRTHCRGVWVGQTQEERMGAGGVEAALSPLLSGCASSSGVGGISERLSLDRPCSWDIARYLRVSGSHNRNVGDSRTSWET